jgi:hypothetical protein
MASRLIVIIFHVISLVKARIETWASQLAGATPVSALFDPAAASALRAMPTASTTWLCPAGF